MFANECATMRSQGKKHNYMMRVSLGTKLCRRCFKIKGWGQFAALTLVTNMLINMTLAEYPNRPVRLTSPANSN